MKTDRHLVTCKDPRLSGRVTFWATHFASHESALTGNTIAAPEWQPQRAT
jgi:hypothetical protein